MSPRRCHWCCEHIPFDAPVVHPGTDYGDDAPIFCSDACLDWWTPLLAARLLRMDVAWRRLGRAIAADVERFLLRPLTRLLERRS